MNISNFKRKIMAPQNVRLRVKNFGPLATYLFERHFLRKLIIFQKTNFIIFIFQEILDKNDKYYSTEKVFSTS